MERGLGMVCCVGVNTQHTPEVLALCRLLEEKKYHGPPTQNRPQGQTLRTELPWAHLITNPVGWLETYQQ